MTFRALKEAFLKFRGQNRKKKYEKKLEVRDSTKHDTEVIITEFFEVANRVHGINVLRLLGNNSELPELKIENVFHGYSRSHVSQIKYVL